MTEEVPLRGSQWRYPGKNSPPRERPSKGLLTSKHHLEAAIGTPQIGDWINQRFRLEERLGRGGMSVVYRAFDKVKQNQVALKFLSPALLGEPDAIEAFRREAQISMELNHIHTLKVFDLQQHQGTYYLVMELLKGGTLRQLTQQWDESTRETHYTEICRILVEICDALSEAHKNTVHRDLKPENIGLTETRSIKVMDFGLASLTSHHQTTLFREAVTQINAGTPYYMAPELLTGESSGSPQSDQFSVGVIAYELFTGRLPLGMTPSLARVRPDLPPELTAAVDRTLSLSPNSRFPSLAILRDLISRAQSRKPNRWNSLRQKINQNRSLVATLGGCLALGLATLYPLQLRQEQSLRRQALTDEAWQRLSETRQNLDTLTAVIQEKRQALSFLEMQAEVEASFQNSTTAPPLSSSLVSRGQLKAAEQLWDWLAPQVSSENTFTVIEEAYNRAQSTIINGDLSQFDQQVEALTTRREQLEQTIDLAQRSLRDFQVFQTRFEQLQQIALPLPPSITERADTLTELVKEADWPRAETLLQELLPHCQELIDAEFSRTREQYNESLGNWHTLFGDLGAPDLSFIADPEQQAAVALEEFQAGRSAQAIQRLLNASSRLQEWTEEVAQFNQRLASPIRVGSSTIESMGIELIKVAGVYWCRWEIRVMDFTRWIAEENKLSQESAAFWKNPGYPLGPTHPVVGISRRDAKEFSAWLGHKLTRYGRPIGRLPNQSEWQQLIHHEDLQLDRPFGIYADQVQWQSNHFREHYADLRIEPTKFLTPSPSSPFSPSGLMGLTDGVWEWTGTFFNYREQKAIANEAQQWLLAGGGSFGTVAFNAFPPPEPGLSFVLRKEGIGFRPVIVPNKFLDRKR